MMEIASFAAGCFWGVEASFQQLPGVLSTRVGFAGGTMKEPTYQDVCSGETGHAETVQIAYDPDVISYRNLLNVFFSIHDPCQTDGQGSDIGSQYRSIIFYHSEEQQQEAEKMIRELTSSCAYKSPIVTVVIPAGEFWQAENYHQSYYLNMGRRYGGIE